MICRTGGLLFFSTLVECGEVHKHTPLYYSLCIYAEYSTKAPKYKSVVVRVFSVCTYTVPARVTMVVVVVLSKKRGELINNKLSY